LTTTTTIPADATHVVLFALQWARHAAHILAHVGGGCHWRATIERVEWAVAFQPGQQGRAVAAEELAAAHSARAEAQAAGEKRTARLEALEAVHLAFDASRLVLDGQHRDAERRAWEAPRRVLLAIGRASLAAGAGTPDDLDDLEQLAPVLGRLSNGCAHQLARGPQ